MNKSQFSLALLTSVFSMMSTSSLQAACVTGDCAAMGYTKTESACYGDIIRCPFDTSKVFCKENRPLSAGDVLFSDKTTSQFVTSDDKTPIGVVVDPSRRLAMGLNCALKQWANRGASNTNIAGIPDLSPHYNSDIVKNDFNGKKYTKLIVDNCGASCPAAYYAYNYTTAGTSKGEWFLPSAGELWKLEENKTAIKVGLARAGGKLPDGNGIYTYIESSNEGEDKYSGFKMAIYLDFEENSTSFLSEGNKYKSAYLDEDFACPFINF